MLILYVSLLVVGVLFLILSLVYVLPFSLFWLLLAVLLLSLYLYSRYRVYLSMWLLPFVMMLSSFMINVAKTSLADYLYSLNYSYLGITDPSGEVLAAQFSLVVIFLLPVLVCMYFSRGSIIRFILGVFSVEGLGHDSIWKNFLFRVRDVVDNFGVFFKSKRLISGSNPVDLSDCDRVRRRERVLSRVGLSFPDDDLVICRDDSGKPVKISAQERYLHTLVVGPTGVGKTSRILKPIVEQELISIRRSLVRGIPRGLTVIEPKGDFAYDVVRMAHYYNVPVIYIDPLRSDSCRFNPLEGEPAVVAEATRTVLQATFGRQEAFYSKVQEVAARNTVLLLKYLYRDDVTMLDMARLLRDPGRLRDDKNRLAKLLYELGDLYKKARADGDNHEMEWLEYLCKNRERIKELLNYFETEVLDEKMGEKTKQFAMGLRLQVEDIAGNEYLNRVIGGRSDINFDAHLERGGVLVVSTGMGKLGKVGDVFGQFIVMHLQNAVFRRKGDEWSRARHMLVMDEAHRYINPDFERILSMGRGYRCECVLALQSTSQLSMDEKRSFRDSVLNHCRNKITFGGMDSQEARYFAGEFGEYKNIRTEKQYAGNIFFRQPWLDLRYRESERYEPRFVYTDLMELPAFHIVYRIVKDGCSLPPRVGVVDLCYWDKYVKRSGSYRTGLVLGSEDDGEFLLSVSDEPLDDFKGL